MSSAALQAVPQQPTSIGSQSPSASGRPYTAGSSQSRDRDAYYSQPSAAASPQTSSKRTSRRPSGNTANNSHPAAYHSPTESTTTAPASNRSANASLSNGPAASTFPALAPADNQRGVPPIINPRTSSNRPANTNAPAAADRRASRNTHDDRQPTSRRATSDEQSTATAEVHTQGERPRDESAAAASASRARRRAAQSSQGASAEDTQSNPSRSRDSRSAGQPTSSRSHTASAGAKSPTQLSREASEVLNRVVISKPEVDVEREQERLAEAIPHPPNVPTSQMGGLSIVGTEGVEDERRPGGGGRTRHDHSNTKKEKNTKFGEYFLGNTLGEGEFGKVKMGWKQEGGVQVAIKLIRRDTVGTNPTRLAKIYREIAILREISHPNIVRLHEMVETERQIGIILEYASGGELFDYILNHRYLKDNAARRLFAQLVSGVGYLHKKGIVHRDLKLENLLLDRNRNIIITDFGFANMFNPADELGDEIEYNLATKDYVKKMQLDRVLDSGYRRGDLMQTSCGSPCYAAPELVVSDSLYTGRKVDVWSCGVILYAMLAGYLPFDDDPANPEGDNINLLYKYIVSTPLTFPEYVTPHARDLLRRILVPDPRKRADLFEVARHSWLSEYAHVVGFITSSTTSTGDIANTTIPSEEQQESSGLVRSASVREPSKAAKAPSAVGDLARKHGNVDQEEESHPKTSKDNKRRTVQVEYVAPRSQTQRGEPSPSGAPAGASKSRARPGSQGPIEISQGARGPITTKAVDPAGRRQSASNQGGMGPPLSARQARDPTRSVSESQHSAPPLSGQHPNARPNTGGSMTSNRSGSLGIPNRGSYGQPAAPTVAGTNAHGRMSQPKSGSSYSIPAPVPLNDQSAEYGKPSSGVPQIAPKAARVAGVNDGRQSAEPAKSHKRSSTIGGIFSRTNSIFGGKSNQEKPEKTKKYPPVSYSNNLDPHEPRRSTDSRRSISFGLGKKRSGSITGGSQSTLQEKRQSRRFSLLPASFSLKAIGIGKDSPTDDRPESMGYYRDTPPHGLDSPTASENARTGDGVYDRGGHESPGQDRRFLSQSSIQDPRPGQPPLFLPPINFQQNESALTTESESSLNQPRQTGGSYPSGFNEYENSRKPMARSNNGRGVLQKNNRRFADAYEQDNGFGPSHVDNAGSSGAARKVMDFFRRRGKARGDDR